MKSIAESLSESKGQAHSPCSWPDEEGPYLFRFALSHVRDRSVAEDLVQETFLSALKCRQHFRAEASERTWLTSILRHKICDHFRDRSRNRLRSLAFPERDECTSRDADGTMDWIHEVAAECTGPNRRLELDEFRASLERALRNLPPRIAQVFRLYEVEERSNRDVCAELCISEGNLWVMLHRARKHLRDELAGQWKSDGAESNRVASARA